jgi:N-acetylneuraminic acid mutarotase
MRRETFLITRISVFLFSSILLAQPVDYSDFNSGDWNGWTAVNGNSTNKWNIGLSVGYNNTLGVFISDDDGASNTYSTNESSVVHLYKDINFTLTDDFALTLRWRGKGEIGKDYLSAHIVPTNVTPVAGEEMNQGHIGADEYSNSDFFRGARIKIGSNLITSGQMRLVLSWRNDDSGGEQPPAAIDNVGITKLDLPYGMWKTHSSMPGQRYYAGSTRNGHSMVIAGGDITGGGVATNQVLEYDMVRNSWGQLAPLQEPVRLNALVKFDGGIISQGGFKDGSNNPTDEVNRLDLNTFSWEAFGTYPKKTFYTRAVVMNWQYLYMFGGSDENNVILNDVNYLEKGSNTWKPATPIPGDGRADGGITALDDNRFLLVGGFTNQFDQLQVDSVFVGTINLSNPAEIVWKSAPNFPAGPRARFHAYPWGDGKAIVVGGSDSDAFPSFNDVWVFDADAESDASWTQLTNKPTPITAYQGTTMNLFDNVWMLYIIGGITTGPALTPINEAYIDTLEFPVSVEEISSETPTNFLLAQNYPNPFNPSTIIQFSIPEHTFVKLEIFNTLGEVVDVLLAEELNAGTYKYNWIAKNLTSGIYFYKLQTTGFSESKKMILLK